VNELNPGIAVQLAVHKAVRRDVARMTTALERGASAPAIADYWTETARQLHHHHELEDAVVWPLMGERLGDRVTGLLTRNAGEHVTMSRAMDDFDSSVRMITTSGPAPALDALARLTLAIDTHLAHEEADVIPLIVDAFTADDFAVFTAESAKGNPPDAFLPWVLDDASPEHTEFFAAHLPEDLQRALNASWLPERSRLLNSLQAGSVLGLAG
jgi:hypothetical protein